MTRQQASYAVEAGPVTPSPELRLWRSVLVLALRDENAASWLQTRDGATVCALAGFDHDAVVSMMTRRAGELLQQIEPGHGARDGKRGEGDHTPLTREEAAREAGMSKHQQVQATRP